MWVGTRNDRGELVPLAEFSDSDITCLGVTAGLQGMSLAAWMGEVLRVSLEREEANTQPLPIPGDGKPCLGLDLDDALMNQLTRYALSSDDFADDAGGALHALVCFCADPWHVDVAARLMRGASEPAEVAGAVVAESYRHIETATDLVNLQRRSKPISLSWLVPLTRGITRGSRSSAGRGPGSVDPGRCPRKSGSRSSRVTRSGW